MKVSTLTPAAFVADADRMIEVLHEAKLRPIGPEQERFVEESCADDEELKKEIVSLLRADPGESDSDLLASIPVSRSRAIFTEQPGDRIGRYKLLEQIGEGGCGVVHLAEQEEPVRRRVALKVIKLGMNTREVIARFEAERQALALMDHPNIARVYDAGATETGRPYFVMELVRGRKITAYCDEHRIPLEGRLRLFMQVCEAIQHAHLRGIIHRDIKPSNTLVTDENGAPVPKVIDFGIAKATGGKLTEHTICTQIQHFIGTPAYMSPEQADGRGHELDFRSDVYSLGILLYELLTEKTPFDAERLLASGVNEVRRAILETEPPMPSTRLSKMSHSELAGVAERRQSEPAKLLHLIRGDLDCIAMKCLEKDPERRYDAAIEVAIDLQRHLGHVPVRARRPSRAYQAGRWLRRNKTLAVSFTVVLLAFAAAFDYSRRARVREAAQERVAGEVQLIADDRLREISNFQYQIATAVRDENPAEAYRLMSAASGSGNLPAQNYRGLMISNGQGAAKDLVKAAAEFRAAAEAGSADGAFYLGECYLRGLGVRPDPVLAVEWLGKAADAGHLRAMSMLGMCYHRGLGTKKDFAKALDLFTRSSELGFSEAFGNLAALHMNGDGVPRDQSKGFELLNKGAALGHPHSMQMLGRCYQFGIGVEKNAPEAKQWYQRAASAGYRKPKPTPQ